MVEFVRDDYTHPYEASRSERNILTDTELVGWTGKVFDTSGDEGPLGHRGPEEDGPSDFDERREAWIVGWGNGRKWPDKMRKEG